MSLSTRRKSLTAILEELRQRDLMKLAERMAKQHHVLLEEMLGTDRTTPSTRARHALWAELFSTGYWSCSRIAELFGLKDHTGVYYAVRRYQKRATAASLASTPPLAAPSAPATQTDPPPELPTVNALKGVA
jgi:chromosomal replication initiation ATPase DnaA